jgi:fatty acyl-CoA reductase
MFTFRKPRRFKFAVKNVLFSHSSYRVDAQGDTRMLANSAKMSPSKILDFYENQSVFITGGAGFIGKVLIEKLLRSTKVATIYVLIRAKKDNKPSTRLDEILNCAVNILTLKSIKNYSFQLFDKLREEHPDYKNRVTAISGDCTQGNLGLALEDRQELISKTNIVFHVAATVDFNENIKSAYDVNVKGTKIVLEFCKKIENLKVILITILSSLFQNMFKSVVHTSTAYVQSHLDTLDEVIYDHPLHYEQAESMLERLSLEEAFRRTPR